MSQIPRDARLDSTPALFRDGYEFISKRCRKHGSDVFETRLMLERAICLRGREAARVFYDDSYVTRRGSLPRTALELLLDFGSVSMLDGDAHRHRKQMFMSMMTVQRIADLADLVAGEWWHAVERWSTAGRITLSDEVQEVLCRAVCTWAGIPLGDDEARQRARELGVTFDGAGSIGLRQVRGRVARRRVESWIERIVRSVRAHELKLPEGSAAHTIVWHRDTNGELLDERPVVVEILNVLRPTVAIARFVTFAALALHDHPEWRREIQTGGDDRLRWFVQEVRRFYPFFPMIGGRVQRDLRWRGHRFPRGTWLLLDLYGTNHDAREWDAPAEFRPARFRDWGGSPFDFIPQGGGDYYEGHRCAGEWITIEVMKVAVRALATEMEYDVPAQNLRVKLSRMPAIPNSGFVIRDVKRAE